MGEEGTREFSPAPFLLVGYGNGGNIALTYASQFPAPHLRSVLVINSFSYVDRRLSGILHDYLSVFSCSPETRPDMPVYFHSRYLFSADYLSKVTSALALNIYTAVNNPITLQGRMQLCNGALNHAEIKMKDINIPVITLCSSEDQFVDPLHAEAIVTSRGGELPSIHQVLRSREKTCVIWMKSGHEVFQECKTSMEAILEQMITGYHEKYQVPMVEMTMGLNVSKKKDVKNGKKKKNKALNNFEDHFIDNVLNTLEEVQGSTSNQLHVLSDPASKSQNEWEDFRKKARNANMKMCSVAKKKTTVIEIPDTSKNQVKKGVASELTDPLSPAFERNSNSVYTMGKGSRIYPNPDEEPQVKEYMSWRVKRNKKKVQYLEKSAHVLQKAFRAFLARTMVTRMRQVRAVLFIQRNWRGRMARRKYYGKQAMDWAVRLVQRQWRGRTGRGVYQAMRRKRLAVISIQKVVRGRAGRIRVDKIRKMRHGAALKIQAIFKAQMAQLVSHGKRQRKNASVLIQVCMQYY